MAFSLTMPKTWWKARRTIAPTAEGEMISLMSETLAPTAAMIAGACVVSVMSWAMTAPATVMNSAKGSPNCPTRNEVAPATMYPLRGKRKEKKMKGLRDGREGG